MSNATIVSQLRTLEQLTRTEVQIARTRTAQARTDAVRRELRQIGDNAERRAERIAGVLRDLGEVPDVVAPAVGYAVHQVAGAVEQLVLEREIAEQRLVERLCLLDGALHQVDGVADGGGDDVRHLTEVA